MRISDWSSDVCSSDLKGFDLLRTYWRQRHPDDFDRFWETGLRSGVIEAASAPLPTPSVREVAIPPASDARAANVDDIELVFRPDPYIGDGRYANNGWLQELPKPGTQLSWGNAIVISPSLADRSIGRAHV